MLLESGSYRGVWERLFPAQKGRERRSANFSMEEWTLCIRVHSIFGDPSGCGRWLFDTDIDYNDDKIRAVSSGAEATTGPVLGNMDADCIQFHSYSLRKK